MTNIKKGETYTVTTEKNGTRKTDGQMWQLIKLDGCKEVTCWAAPGAIKEISAEDRIVIRDVTGVKVKAQKDRDGNWMKEKSIDLEVVYDVLGKPTGTTWIESEDDSDLPF